MELKILSKLDNSLFYTEKECENIYKITCFLKFCFLFSCL